MLYGHRPDIFNLALVLMVSGSIVVSSYGRIIKIKPYTKKLTLING